ncbi:hypothetical protein [Sphingomonas cavernae]|uniref:Uncharacterized protein n=1 Tax=Sphingomonas cavernae TaxID=2320861 RepID=A0A418WPQ7_9SPHN|nr:hypothetical protein [Sphingomonas cavernae]RJF93210.1 hypothetical protein D3876_02295 [Sphingomonas cavernae]
MPLAKQVGGVDREADIALMALSACLAILRLGPYQGPVAWIGLLSLAGITLVLLMSRWRHGAIALWIPATLGALLMLPRPWL